MLDTKEASATPGSVGSAYRLNAISCDQRGSTSIIFAFCLVALCGFIGGAIDMAIYFSAKRTYAEAMDAAALAAARTRQISGSDDAAVTQANAMMATVRNNHGMVGNVSFAVDTTTFAVVGTASLIAPSIFLRVIGIESLPINLINKAEYVPSSELELSLMLDTTGSMSGSKIDDLKSAVESLIDIIIPEKPDGMKSRIALAPFSNAVALNTKQFRASTGSTSGDGGCVVERNGTEAYTDKPPRGGAYLRRHDDVARGRCSASNIFPLTSKKGELKKMVKALQTGGPTAGHLGTAWAWYLLSPEWADLYEEDELPKSYASLAEKLPGGKPKLRKIAILMTDGEYNTSYSTDDSTTQARALCREMQKTGIEVFTVGFALGTSETVLETLRGCASALSNFYRADNGNDLKRAFTDIALKAKSIRLSK